MPVVKNNKAEDFLKANLNILPLLLKLKTDEHVKNNINHFGGYWDRKSDLVFEHVIPAIQRILATHVCMAIAGEVFPTRLKMEKNCVGI